ncbi:unnamed protein product [Ostreobium quekettii]|uniref:1-alkyl-2-acetylglycerophosphocholine esterase n=1 Tax=Ostreobium quekettii TaxID=121088 RepID=A0A8S1J6X6_9CHLO|nr:unnamed protein product [Ostreobium quekettii]
MELQLPTVIFFALLASQAILPLGAARPGSQLPTGRFLLQDVSFANTKEQMRLAAEQKPYGDVLLLNSERVCGYHLLEVLPPSCDPAAMNQALCCAAVLAFFDEGQCLCQPRLQFLGGVAAVQTLLALGPQCGSQFPFPSENEGLLSLRNLEQCRPTLEESTVGQLTPESVGLTAEELAALEAVEIPLFVDLYKPAFEPIFPVNTVTVNVTRKYPSVLSSPDSTATTFNAMVFYPDDPKGKKGNFPLVTFAPGLGGSPRSYNQTLTFLASQGAVVVSPLSTQWISPLDSFEFFKAYGGDVANALAWVLGDGTKTNDDDDDDDDDDMDDDLDDDIDDDVDDDDNGDIDGDIDDDVDDDVDDDLDDDDDEDGLAASIRSLVDVTRVGVLGHSYGGAMALEAAVVAQQNFSISIDGVFSTSPICVLASDVCDIPYEAAAKLEDMRVKFYVGELDEVSPPSHAEVFNSRLPKSAAGQFMELEGATHCFVEEDPKNWPIFNSQCGKGTISPFDQVAEWQRELVSFFKLD